MKSKTLLSIACILALLAIIPLSNFFLGNIHNSKEDPWWSEKTLYNVDFTLPYLSKPLYSAGISINSGQAIIGKDGWLFLGDDYEKTLTETRSPPSDEDLDKIAKITTSVQLLDEKLKMSGVKIFKIIICPNKSSIYPEYLPNWAQPANPNTIDVLTAKNKNLYIDTRSALTTQKANYNLPLFYKTDTHWNNLGAWLAFKKITDDISSIDRGLKFIDINQVQVIGIKDRMAGDLARFLSINKTLKESDIVISMGSKSKIKVDQYDFSDMSYIKTELNINQEAPKVPTLFKSKDAINKKRVLWLRDSFGTAMSPFMSATFSDLLQVHYGETNPAILNKLIGDFKPDYVLISVVERAATGGYFSQNF